MDVVKMEGASKHRCEAGAPRARVFECPCRRRALSPCPRPAARAIVDAGIGVMGHIGLTPQSVSVLGGFRAQGKTGARSGPPPRHPPHTDGPGRQWTRRSGCWSRRTRSRRRAASRS